MQYTCGVWSLVVKTEYLMTEVRNSVSRVCVSHLLYVGDSLQTELCGVVKVVGQHGQEGHNVERETSILAGVKDWAAGMGQYPSTNIALTSLH